MKPRLDKVKLSSDWVFVGVGRSRGRDLLNPNERCDSRCTSTIRSFSMNEIFTLSPSDAAFLWRECPRCFWLKGRHGIQQPRMPFPSVFTTIDSEMKNRLDSVPISEFVSGAPESRVHNHDGRVLSQVYQSKFGTKLQIKGVYDTVLELGQGGYCLVDLKTIKPTPKLAATYSLQLHSYMFALENPAIEEDRLAPVSRLGLITFGPNRFTSRSDGASALVGQNHWLEVERSDESFFGFLDQVAELLDSDTPPGSGKYCSTCQYLERIGRFESEQSRFKTAV